MLEATTSRLNWTPLGAFDHRFEQNRRTPGIDISVVGDLIHALPDADSGGEMNNNVDSAERTLHDSWRADVADDQFDSLIQIGGRSAFSPMDLHVEIVERANLIALAEQQCRAMRGDKAGTSGNQNGFGHSSSELPNYPARTRLLQEGSNVLAENRDKKPISASTAGTRASLSGVGSQAASNFGAAGRHNPTRGKRQSVQSCRGRTACPALARPQR